jgi:hypothetical protein
VIEVIRVGIEVRNEGVCCSPVVRARSLPGAARTAVTSPERRRPGEVTDRSRGFPRQGPGRSGGDIRLRAAGSDSSMKIERTSRMATNIDYPRALLALLAAAVLAAGLLAFLGAKPARAADPSFVAAPNSPFAVGSAPTTVTNVDFDNDGNMDLAAQNSSSNNVSVLLGDGDGDFQKAPNSPFAVGSTPSSVISADFNGDGKADLAVTNQNSRSVSVLLGDGTGDFQKAPNSPFTVGGASWAQPSSVISAHYNDDNADGKVDSTDFVDLAVANLESHDVSVLLGNGDGNFQAAKNFTMGSNPNQVISADFNGDNKADLVTANWGRCQPFPSCQSLNVRGGFSVRLGNGDGTFQSSMTHELDHAYSITTEDFNGDGKADLAVPLYSSKRVWVYLNKGAGIFVNWEIVATGLEANPVAVASADLDSDSKADLAVTNFASGLSDNVSVLFGSGNGSFQATKNFPTGDGPVFVVGADLTDDSRVDLAVANQDSHNVSVLLNTAVDTIAPRVVHVSCPRNQRGGQLLGGDGSEQHHGPDLHAEGAGLLEPGSGPRPLRRRKQEGYPVSSRPPGSGYFIYGYHQGREQRGEGPAGQRAHGGQGLDVRHRGHQIARCPGHHQPARQQRRQRRRLHRLRHRRSEQHRRTLRGVGFQGHGHR